MNLLVMYHHWWYNDAPSLVEAQFVGTQDWAFSGVMSRFWNSLPQEAYVPTPSLLAFHAFILEASWNTIGFVFYDSLFSSVVLCCVIVCTAPL